MARAEFDLNNSYALFVSLGLYDETQKVCIPPMEREVPVEAAAGAATAEDLTPFEQRFGRTGWLDGNPQVEEGMAPLGQNAGLDEAAAADENDGTDESPRPMGAFRANADVRIDESDQDVGFDERDADGRVQEGK